ncbi:unnamed protein product [Callosobruchus maculatus]|uniref:Secreted protein n=1 Tax=Callosobruchus maculatus TaxID=64391 RepID=A0A653C9Q2_CALMS|nr:unnamed protein product [Callosobruchus maculatus]
MREVHFLFFYICILPLLFARAREHNSWKSLLHTYLLLFQIYPGLKLGRFARQTRQHPRSTVAPPGGMRRNLLGAENLLRHSPSPLAKAALIVLRNRRLGASRSAGTLAGNL